MSTASAQYSDPKAEVRLEERLLLLAASCSVPILRE